MHACCQGSLEIVAELVLAGADLAAVRRQPLSLSFLTADTQQQVWPCGVRRFK